MKIDEMFLIGGSDIDVDGVTVRQPTLGDIRRPEVGFEKYNAYLNLLGMTREGVVDGLLAAASPDSAPPELPEDLSVYMIVSAVPVFRDLTEQALAFFLGQTVKFDAERSAFVAADESEIGHDNFDKVRSVILQVSGLSSEDAEEQIPKGKKARELWLKRREGRKGLRAAKSTGRRDLSLPNVISAVCARNSGYSLVNIWDLTVWQLYDQFGRININVQTEILSVRWAAYGKDKFPMDFWYKENQQD